MKNNKLLDSFKDYPEIIESPIEMTKANCRIKIYDGIFTLQNDEDKLKIKGEIFFDWLPNSGTYFKGIPVNQKVDTIKILNGNNSFKILIDDLEKDLLLIQVSETLMNSLK